MKKTFCYLLSFLLMLSLSVPAWAADPTFDFRLSADDLDTKLVSNGDVITVTLNLNRTDSNDAYTMYAMQDEIVYDPEFFELVEGSERVFTDVRTTDIMLRGHRRAFYMNYLSLAGGSKWNARQQVGTFQLKVIGTSGVSRISNTEYLVSRQGSSLGSTAQGVTVIISDQCTVKFDTNGGSEVSAQIVPLGGLVTRPTDPVRAGYTFAGWYRDVDCTSLWDFNSSRVEQNLYLFAKWVKDGSAVRPIYRDVTPGDWFYDAVNYVSEKGLMNGVGNGLFAPQMDTSRAMIVTILWRLEGSPYSTVPMTFQDVSGSQWYAEAIRWAAANGIVTGYNAAAFGPNDKITREQMATILYRYSAYKGYDVSTQANLSTYVDAASVGSWAQAGMAWANARGLISGMPGNKLEPQGSAVRCQTATILMRFCENVLH